MSRADQAVAILHVHIRMDRIHLTGKNGGSVPPVVQGRSNRNKVNGNPSSPTSSSNCENGRACFLPNQPGAACVRCISTL